MIQLLINGSFVIVMATFAEFTSPTSNLLAPSNNSYTHSASYSMFKPGETPNKNPANFEAALTGQLANPSIPKKTTIKAGRILFPVNPPPRPKRP